MAKLKADLIVRLLVEVASEDPTDGEEPRRIGIEAQIPAGKDFMSVAKVFDDLGHAGFDMLEQHDLFTRLELL